jgi:CubicO group peptidase (beta-lactamase class C family)
MLRSSLATLLLLPPLLAALGCEAEHGPPLQSAWQTPAIPESEAGARVAAYIDAFNSGDPRKLEEFVRAAMSPVGPGGATLDDRLKSQQSFYNASRGLDVAEVRQPDAKTITIIAKLRLTEQWRQLDFLFDDQSSGKIAGIRMIPAAPHRRPESGAVPFAGQLANYIDRQVAVDQFSGVVLVAEDDQTVYAKAHGFADREQRVANTLDTPYRYASLGKMFTAIAIGQLVQHGKLTFNDILNDVLPNGGITSSQLVTIDHLLSHRSGIQDFFELGNAFEKVRNSDNPQRDYLPIIACRPLNFDPGTRFEYSNSNYIVLGAIIEELSGVSYERYLQENIFEPAGMLETQLSCSEPSRIAPAVGYTELCDNGQLTPGTRRPADFVNIGCGSAAGGGMTTAKDLLHFSRALSNQRLLSAEMLQQLLTPRTVGQRGGEEYGYGFMIRYQDGRTIVGHSGGFPGVDAQFEVYLDSGRTVVVLCNYEAVGESVARFIESSWN